MRTASGRTSTPSARSGRSAASRHAAPATLTIGDLAEEFGVTLRALRFYEAKGLLHPQRRGTTRLYTEEDRTRLATILRGKELGFTLREIAAMVDGDEMGEPGAEPSLTLTPAQVEEQIAHLENQKAEIERALVALRSYGKPKASA
ncbi:MerR family transcriptional regulator [Methylobacterium nodulans]|uniref:Transcriptional regulator, MerR family n=1 Tax=Methylobacterium nodulans (strain LMG 21967 / CNCM I-2342 / ORS 2060) TaxID=460265 RepID=B8ILD7_METNO|nr:MerR family DNA-binding transcriptional regulator [Methylobacterium nodulans]ACL60136.1 transcriptional regulator, MerR family [Methylobacterium nodulans ORS 2060]